MDRCAGTSKPTEGAGLLRLGRHVWSQRFRVLHLHGSSSGFGSYRGFGIDVLLGRYVRAQPPADPQPHFNREAQSMGLCNNALLLAPVRLSLSAAGCNSTTGSAG